jgi:hypothetical protein
MTGTFRVATTHAVTLADGRVRGLTDPPFDIEPGDPHNQALEDDGLIVRVHPESQTSGKAAKKED